jgi:hypothetical protein
MLRIEGPGPDQNRFAYVARNLLTTAFPNGLDLLKNTLPKKVHKCGGSKYAI